MYDQGSKYESLEVGSRWLVKQDEGHRTRAGPTSVVVHCPYYQGTGAVPLLRCLTPDYARIARIVLEYFTSVGTANSLPTKRRGQVETFAIQADVADSAGGRPTHRYRTSLVNLAYVYGASGARGNNRGRSDKYLETALHDTHSSSKAAAQSLRGVASQIGSEYIYRL